MLNKTALLSALAALLLGSAAHAQDMRYRSDYGPFYQQDGGSWGQEGDSTWNAPEPDYRYDPRGSDDGQGRYDQGQYDQDPYGRRRYDRGQDTRGQYGDDGSDQRRYEQGEYDPGQTYPGQADPDQVNPETGDWQNNPVPRQGAPRVNANGGAKDDVQGGDGGFADPARDRALFRLCAGNHHRLDQGAPPLSDAQRRHRCPLRHRRRQGGIFLEGAGDRQQQARNGRTGPRRRR